MSGTRYPTGDGPARDEAARYEAVVRRGRALRRRRRLGTAGAGVVGCAALLAMAFAVLGTGGTDPSVTAGPTEGAPGSTTPPAFGVSARQETGTATGALVVEARDPSQPDSPDAVLCVLVRVGPTGQAAVAEGRACAFPGESSTVTVPLAPSGGVEIGCAGSASPTAPLPTATRDVSATFRFDVGGGFPAGEYPVKVTAVSGVGDGCTPVDPGESLATTDATLTVA